MMDDISISHGFEDPLRWWHVERMNMFTDAVFSIIATITVVTLKYDEEELAQEDFLLQKSLIGSIPQYVAYFGCFFVVSVYWGCHVRLYNLIINSNDVLTWLNLLLLCILSFLPLTLSIWARTLSYRDITVHFPAFNLLLSGITLTVTILYAFRSRASHHTTVTLSQKRQQRFLTLLYAWFPTLIGLFCIYIYKLQEFAMCVIFLLILLTTIVFAKFEEWYLGHSILDIAVQQIYNPVPKERIEAFSDGVYAISMTLIAVQIAEKLAELKDTSDKFITVFGNTTLAYITAYGLTSGLWFVHHQLFNNIERSNPVLQILNIIALSFVGGVPFSSTLIQHYVNPHNFDQDNFDINEGVAIRFHCLVLFFSGFFQALLWWAAVQMRCTRVSLENYSDLLLMFKAMTIPCFACAIYISSIFGEHSSILFLSLTIFYPFLFGIANYIHRGRVFPCIRRIMVRIFGTADDIVESHNNNGLLENSQDPYDEPLLNATSPPYISYTDRRSLLP